eukprot:gene24478-31876_t
MLPFVMDRVRLTPSKPFLFVRPGFEMKVRQNSGAGKIVFRTVKNFNNIPHILEIRVFSFTRGLQVSVYEPRTRTLRWVRLTSAERKLLLLTDSNSNSGLNCIDSLRIDKHLFRTVKKICGQRFIVLFTLTDSTEKTSFDNRDKAKTDDSEISRLKFTVDSEKSSFVAPKMMLKITFIDSVGCKRFTGTMSIEDTFSMLSYKSTWQKMAETMDSNSGTSNAASLSQVPDDVRGIVTNARSEWAVYPDPNLTSTSSQEDAVYPNPTGADSSEQQMVRALLSRPNLLLICNQLQDLPQRQRRRAANFAQYLSNSISNAQNDKAAVARFHDGTLTATLKTRRQMPCVLLEKELDELALKFSREADEKAAKIAEMVKNTLAKAGRPARNIEEEQQRLALQRHLELEEERRSMPRNKGAVQNITDNEDDDFIMEARLPI